MPAASVKTAKFSDLSSYFQALQTRVGVTLAVVALLVGASGANASLLQAYPDGAKPVLLHAAAVLIGFASILAFGALAMHGRLPVLIEKRLGSRNLCSPDDVDEQLHKAFLEEIRRRHTVLACVHDLIGTGFMLISLHLAPAHVMMPIFAGTSPPHDDVCVALGSLPGAPACSFDAMSVLGVLLLGVPVAVFSLYAPLLWRRRRRRFKATQPWLG